MFLRLAGCTLPQGGCGSPVAMTVGEYTAGTRVLQGQWHSQGGGTESSWVPIGRKGSGWVRARHTEVPPVPAASAQGLGCDFCGHNKTRVGCTWVRAQDTISPGGGRLGASPLPLPAASSQRGPCRWSAPQAGAAFKEKRHCLSNKALTASSV